MAVSQGLARERDLLDMETASENRSNLPHPARPLQSAGNITAPSEVKTKHTISSVSFQFYLAEHDHFSPALLLPEAWTPLIPWFKAPDNRIHRSQRLPEPQRPPCVCRVESHLSVLQLPRNLCGFSILLLTPCSEFCADRIFLFSRPPETLPG